MARMLRLTHDELYEFVKLYDLLRDMDFELTPKQVDVFDRVQSMENTYEVEDVETCITDGNDYKDCVDRMVETMDKNQPYTAPFDTPAYQNYKDQLGSEYDKWGNIKR